MSETWYPSFSYHPTEAPKGRKFTNEAEYTALGPAWVDTPTKFPVLNVTAPLVAPDAGAETETPAPKLKKGKA